MFRCHRLTFVWSVRTATYIRWNGLRWRFPPCLHFLWLKTVKQLENLVSFSWLLTNSLFWVSWSPQRVTCISKNPQTFSQVRSSRSLRLHLRWYHDLPFGSAVDSTQFTSVFEHEPTELIYLFLVFKRLLHRSIVLLQFENICLTYGNDEKCNLLTGFEKPTRMAPCAKDTGKAEIHFSFLFFSK